MVQKKSYSRYFIILQEDEKGYSISSDKVASGYAKLEVKNDKCKISYYVQNLKKELAPYYMMLICNKKEVKKVIKVGEMNIDDYGRADVSYDYPIESIADSSISVDKVSGAAIVKLLENNIVGVMSGFASTEIPEWKSFELVQRNTNEEEVRMEEETKSIFEKYEESIEALKLDEKKDNSTEGLDNRSDNENKDNVRQNEEDKNDKVLNENVKDEENLTADIEELKRDEENDVREDTKADKEDIQITDEEQSVNENINSEFSRQDREELNDYPRGSTGDFFRGLVNGFEEITDIASDIKRAKWYRVAIETIEDMQDVSDYNRYTILYYPMMSYYPYFEKHGHYLVGYKCDKKGMVKYLVYGIPGSRSKEHQPYGGKTGFVTWVPANARYSEDNEFGYWLMFYDFRTSTIVVPVKK